MLPYTDHPCPRSEAISSSSNLPQGSRVRCVSDDASLPLMVTVIPHDSC